MVYKNSNVCLSTSVFLQLNQRISYREYIFGLESSTQIIKIYIFQPFLCIRNIEMETTRVKQEIKEEIPDEMYTNDEEHFANISTPQNVKFDYEFEEELSDYEYSEPVGEYNAIEDVGDSSLGHSSGHPAERSATEQQHHVEYEDVYVDGEPEVCLENFPVLIDNRPNESASDPLAFHAPVAEVPHNVDQPRKEPKLYVVRTVRAEQVRKVLPVKALVNRTYSSKHRTANKVIERKQLFTCVGCNQSFHNPLEYQRHKNSCYFKCEKCNLIYRKEELFIMHQKKYCSKHANKTLKEDGQPLTFNTPDQFRRKKISCNICYTELESTQQLEAHRKENHFTPNAYACHLCDRKFDSDMEAVIHLNRDH